MDAPFKLKLTGARVLLAAIFLISGITYVSGMKVFKDTGIFPTLNL